MCFVSGPSGSFVWFAGASPHFFRARSRRGGISEQSGPDLGPHSILYNDRSSSNQYKRGGTGYNHAEMVYNERRYSSREHLGIGGLGSDDPSFSEGQPNPPMQGGRDFLSDDVFVP